MIKNLWIRFLLLTNGLVLVAAAMLWPIFALFVERIDGNLLDASIARAIFGFVAGCVVLISGRRADRYAHKEYIVALWYVLMWVWFLLYLWAWAVWHIFLIQVLIGLGEAIYSPPFDALYSLNLSEDHEWEERWMWEAMQYIVWSVGALVGWLLVTYVWFNALFICMAALCFVSAGVCVVQGKNYLK